jgi:predicted enzyme related to lactoylglutathione lyase
MKPFQMLLLIYYLAAITACTNTLGPVMSGISLSDAPLTGKFIWHDLISTDIEADKRFYSGLFGWQYEYRQGPNGNSYTLAKSGEHYIAGLVNYDKPEDGAVVSRWLGYLSVDDVDLAVRENMAAGGNTVVKPEELGDFVRVAAITDPQGAVLGVAQSHIGDPVDSIAGGPGYVVWNELLASDTVEAAAFYRALAGYEIEVLDRYGGKYTMLVADGVRRAGILGNPLEGVTPLWLTYFGVSDLEATTARVSELGGRVLLPPSADVRNGNLALVVGPSGALLALQQWPM